MAVAFARQLALVALSTTAYVAELAEPQTHRIERLRSATFCSSPAAILETRPHPPRIELPASKPATPPPPNAHLSPRLSSKPQTSGGVRYARRRADCSKRALPESTRRRASPSPIRASAGTRESPMPRGGIGWHQRMPPVRASPAQVLDTPARPDCRLARESRPAAAAGWAHDHPRKHAACTSCCESKAPLRILVACRHASCVPSTVRVIFREPSPSARRRCAFAHSRHVLQPAPASDQTVRPARSLPSR
ncbi:hypothetical protein B0H15DRAFT_943610 [Mycena belliarum]|uniref:Uncharacterized protein n=1 Tax=Mycena belliarum TaxID=1033014 RepID=A0AAD6Y0L0_9AGAR|nr:hypothetical protein B0H15DRAFT_943610 [Mycena belliae]